MCGICGYADLRGRRADRDVLNRMNLAIAHRGPDGEGLYIDGSVGLGHRRLTILDLTDNASQPMISSDGNYVIVYNGETYNFRELREELLAMGYRFKSTGDTEVLLYAYIAWGEACLLKLNGMVAFAVYDKLRQEIFCARDRYGIKPFYFAFIGDYFLFGSEQKAIYAHPAFRHDLDLDAVVEYFTFQNILTNRTFEKQIHTLEPGCCFTVKLNAGLQFPQIRRYWDFRFAPDETYATEDEFAQELDRLLVQAVTRQLVSDTEVGSFLSGGMDSGTITCIASRAIPHIKTFTCGYDMSKANEQEKRFDERGKTEIMAHYFQTEHYEMILQPSDIERALPAVCRSNEEPRVGQTYTNYYISNLASRFLKVAFSGTGGDELFGGYPWRYYRGMNAKSFDEFVDGYYMFWQRLIPGRALRDAFSPVWQEISADPKQIFRSVFDGHDIPLNTPADYISHAMYFEAKTFLPGMLMIEDKLTMVHGLESRVPMLDNDLVDFAMKLPVRYKLKDLDHMIEITRNDPSIRSESYYNVTNLGKYLLRKTMEKYIPKEIDRAHKQGFSAPDATWFRSECADFVRRVIYNDKARMWEILDRRTVQALVDEHMQDKANRRLLVWSLLNFEQLLNMWY